MCVGGRKFGEDWRASIGCISIGSCERACTCQWTGSVWFLDQISSRVQLKFECRGEFVNTLNPSRALEFNAIRSLNEGDPPENVL